jgi:riboflavin kinase
MKIDGEVTAGMGKAEFFLSQEFYTNEFKKNLGFVPYPGTLNIIVGN